ncbi:cleavage and polyadenylation specificity factor subunit 3-I [Triticum aestivum]|uniref:cleavage and polyadenylation specificity factor subunit 3-I n=1 Tax=Triticum aestivum TaxID=4565 RepID=UPI001D02C82C|nr:cleavage and polyadenylation specificity factor subunit 3-I-like [Triticum aestivum]
MALVYLYYTGPEQAGPGPAQVHQGDGPPPHATVHLPRATAHLPSATAHLPRLPHNSWPPTPPHSPYPFTPHSTHFICPFPFRRRIAARVDELPAALLRPFIVYHSAIFGNFKGRTVLFDCGIHPAYSDMAALPYSDEIDPSTIDVLLVTHFHLDHAASLPYFLEKTTFKGRVFMTHATKAIYRLLLSDYVKVSKVSVEDMLFDEQDIIRSMDKIEVIDFHQTLEVNGIRFWCYTAGHVLGAAMFMVDIAGVRILYTGDYSREEDRHLKAAEIPQFSPDICIIESTYGVQQHQPRHVREKRFTDAIHNTVSQGGRVLIPAYALGRAHERFLILDEYWSNHLELHKIPY